MLFLVWFLTCDVCCMVGLCDEGGLPAQYGPFWDPDAKLLGATSRGLLPCDVRVSPYEPFLVLQYAEF